MSRAVLLLALTLIGGAIIVETRASSEVAGKRYEPTWQSLDTRPAPQWYDEVKVGIFIHWGVFSVPSFHSEWFWWNWQGLKDKDCSEFMKANYRPGFSYADFAPDFRAEFFDPQNWADLFEKAGAKYVVLTSKHHEGYTLWPSNVSWNWNSMDVGSKRDLVGDLANAIRSKNGIHFGLYHSLFEWFNPLYLADKRNGFKSQTFVERKTMPELTDIVTAYKPDVIWSDGDWEASPEYWNSTQFLAWLYNDSPVKDTVLVNDRWGSGVGCKHGDFFNCQDRYNPGVLIKHKWENAFTLDKKSWGYRRSMNITEVMSIHELLYMLASTVSCNGNILINIGPTKEGTIAPIFEERLLQLGSWLKVNGEAIYNTRPWTHQNDTLNGNVWYTSSGNAVYAIVLKWPANYIVTLGDISSSVNQQSNVTMLGVPGTLKWQSNGKQTAIELPILTPSNAGSLQWAFVLKFTL